MVNLLDPWVLALTVVAFICSRAASGVISEYAKRLWFGFLEPRLSRLCKATFRASAIHQRTALEAELDALKADNCYLAKKTESLIVENDDLLAENIKLRLALRAASSMRKAS